MEEKCQFEPCPNRAEFDVVSFRSEIQRIACGEHVTPFVRELEDLDNSAVKVSTRGRSYRRKQRKLYRGG